MQTLDELAKEQKLSATQLTAVKNYVSGLVIELLESIKEDNIKNFDDTINSVRAQA